MEIHGPTLRAIRLRTPNMTATRASACIGVSQPTWSNWEQGRRNASAPNIVAIADLLRIDDIRVLVPYATPSELSTLHELAAA